MKKVLLAAYLLMAVLGIVLLAWVIPANTEDSGYGLSPALLPNILATLLLVTSLVLLGNTVRSCTDEASPITARHLVRLAAFAAIFLGTFPLMSLIGFFPGGVVSMLLIQLMCGQKDPRWLIGLSLALPGIFYAAMKTFLQVPLP